MQQTTSTSHPVIVLPFTADELGQFKSIIRAKVDVAEGELRMAHEALLHQGSNGTDDTYVGIKGLDEGKPSLEREELMMLATRQQKFIRELNLALDRIRAGNYGICRATGARIPAERLRLVPHATLCVEAKEQIALGA
jgi:DnaK suppressor protein